MRIEFIGDAEHKLEQEEVFAKAPWAQAIRAVPNGWKAYESAEDYLKEGVDVAVALETKVVFEDLKAGERFTCPGWKGNEDIILTKLAYDPLRTNSSAIAEGGEHYHLHKECLVKRVSKIDVGETANRPLWTSLTPEKFRDELKTSFSLIEWQDNFSLEKEMFDAALAAEQLKESIDTNLVEDFCDEFAASGGWKEKAINTDLDALLVGAAQLIDKVIGGKLSPRELREALQDAELAIRQARVEIEAEQEGEEVVKAMLGVMK